MNRFRIFASAAIAVALSVCMASCTIDEDEEIVLDSTVWPTIADEILNFESENLTQQEDTTSQFVVTVDDASCPIEKIVLLKTEALVYTTLEVDCAPTRAQSTNVISCAYETNADGTFTIHTGDLLGDIEIEMTENPEQDPEQNPEGGEEQKSNTNIKIGDNNYQSTTQEISTPEEPDEVNLCRKWGNATYAASVYIDELSIFGAQESEKVELADIRVLKQQIIDKLLTGTTMKDTGFNFLERNILGLTFATDGQLYVAYSDNYFETSKWEWVDKENNKIKTTIDGTEVEVSVRYKSGTPNEAYFVIDANLDGIEGLGVHTLSGSLICHMTD